jgi:hypothetical protein
MTAWVERTWASIGNWIVGHHRLVAITSILLMLVFAVGLTKVKTTVQLLKLFDSNAKILHDYRWMEENLGELVPAELVICIDRDAQKEPYVRAVVEAQKEIARNQAPPGTPEASFDGMLIDYDRNELDLKYSMLERVELSSRVRRQLEKFFGPDGLGIVGSGMSTDVLTPLFRIDSQVDSLVRKRFSASLDAKRNEMLEQDYLAEVTEKNLALAQGTDAMASETEISESLKLGREMWRVSIRLAALNDVDYGQFVNDLKRVVEPILNAYQARTKVLKKLQSVQGENAADESSVLVLGRNPNNRVDNIRAEVAAGKTMAELIDQTYIFSDSLQDLLENRGIADVKDKARPNGKKYYVWLDPDRNRADEPGLTPEQLERRVQFFEPERMSKFIKQFDCVVVVEDDPLFDLALVESQAKSYVDCREHTFHVDPVSNLPIDGQLTAMQLKKSGEEREIATIYTGIVPIVYKAQRSLLQSLIESIGLAFGMISIVMMILLRDWGSPVGPRNLLNIRGGLVAMIPNVFPVVVVFGFMGHWGIEIDIGSMMTASVAMGVAVDDTIHFLNWYRLELADGRSRIEAIKEAYSRVATAMTQTTLIGGLGLAAFSLSTFTPTQRFGVLMLFLLVMALVGDLILLPALLAGPLGKYFGKEKPQPESGNLSDGPFDDEEDVDFRQATLRLVASETPDVNSPDVNSPDVNSPDVNSPDVNSPESISTDESRARDVKRSS